MTRTLNPIARKLLDEWEERLLELVKSRSGQFILRSDWIQLPAAAHSVNRARQEFLSRLGVDLSLIDNPEGCYISNIPGVSVEISCEGSRCDYRVFVDSSEYPTDRN